MIHLRIVVPRDSFEPAIDTLDRAESVCNLIVLRDAARKPAGDVILCDVAREDASVVIAELQQFGVDEYGSIAIEHVDSEVSRAAEKAERAAPGLPADAVVWEDVVARTADESRLSVVYVTFMVVAMIIAAVGIFLNSPILIVGAMVVGPEFGPIAGVCVAAVQRRPEAMWRSTAALLVGFPAGITATVLFVLAARALGITPDAFSSEDHSLSASIASPDAYSVIVAFCAGVAGMLALTSSKSGALIGVLISVTTIPAAANIAVAFVYSDWPAWRGSQEQLLLNVSVILGAGLLTLGLQRFAFERRLHRRMRAATETSIAD